MPSWEDKSEKVPPGNKNKGSSFSRALIPSHLHTQGCCFFSSPLTFMISSPPPRHSRQPTNMLLFSHLRRKTAQNSLSIPLYLHSFALCLTLPKKKKKKIRKIPILLFLIPPLRFFLEPLPTKLSHPALQLPGVEQAACVPAGASIGLS